jgi:hypothetical protein
MGRCLAYMGRSNAGYRKQAQVQVDLLLRTYMSSEYGRHIAGCSGSSFVFTFLSSH